MTLDDKHDDVMHTLSALAPTDADQPVPADEAWRQLQTRISATQTAGPHPYENQSIYRRMLTMMNRAMQRRLAFAAVAIALIAAVFSFPQARAAASEFLSLFRVQKFAAISVSPEQIARLQELDVDGLYPGEFTQVEEPTEPQTVDSIEEAADLAYGLNRSLYLGNALGTPQTINVVADGGAGELVVNLEGARGILEAAGVDPMTLPDALDGAAVSVDAGPAVMMEWADGVRMIQTTSPEIAYPDGFDPADVGYALLQLLGMEEDEAYRLAQSIDWTNTLLLPIPQEVATFAEVNVNGNSGLMISAVSGQNSQVVWESNGVVHMVSVPGTGDDLLAVVDALNYR